MIRKLILTIFLILAFAVPGWGTTYYVDSTCTDTNPASGTVDGTAYDPATPACTGGSDSYYVTIADVNAKALLAGDIVSFRKGQTWRETLTVDSAGSSENVITYTAHGSGANPKIIGSDLVATWTANTTSSNLVDQDGGSGSNTDKGAFTVPGLHSADHAISDDMQSDNTGDWTLSDCTATFDTDHYEMDFTGATQYFYYSNSVSITDGQLYFVTIDVKDGTLASQPAALKIGAEFYGATTALDESFTTTNAWVTHSFYFVGRSDTDSVGIYGGMVGAGNIEWRQFHINEVDVSWVRTGTNTVEIAVAGGETGDGLKITGTGTDTGATLALSAASDLTTNLTVSTLYIVTFDAKVGSGDSVDVEVAQSDETQLGTVTVTETTYTAKSFTFTASNVSTDKLQLDNLANTEEIWIDNLIIGVANVWSATLATDPGTVFFDGTLGTEESAVADLNAANEWYWNSNVLYAYSTSDPDTAYTSPGIEASVRTSGISVVGNYDYITIDGVDTEKAMSFGVYFNTGADYGTVENSTHKDSGLQGIRVFDDTAVCTYFTADNVTLHDNLAGGLYIQSGTNWTVMNSTAYNNDVGGASNEKGFTFDDTDPGTLEDSTAYNEYYGFNFHDSDNITINRIKGYNNTYNSLAIGYGSTRITVSDSEFYGSSDHNVFINSTTTNISGITFKRTISYNAAASKDGWRQSGNIDTVYGATKFEYCLAWGNYRGFEILAGEGQFRGVVSYNNTKDGIFTSVANTVIRNSIVSENTEYGFRFEGATGISGVDSDYNDIHEGGGAQTVYWNDTAYGDLATYQSASSQDANSTEADPLFTSPGSNDFTLQSGSPAIDAGTDLGASYDDGLDPDSTWPSSVTTLDQDLHGNGWEIGVYVYETIWRWGD